jgi:hypothetical protein
MSAGKELWRSILSALKGNAALMALVDGVHDKAPKEPWGEKQTYISRGPFSGSPDDADCILGQEITAQIDIWSREPNRWVVDDVIAQVRKSLHEAELPFAEGAIAAIQVRLWRVTDDPDPNQQHGLVQILAVIEEAEEA